MNNFLCACGATVLVSALCGTGIVAHAQSAELPVYTPAQQISGNISIWGSPQMGDLLLLYERGFTAMQPAVRFQNDLKSTITAVAGVYTGRADIGLLGREIWPTEVQAFASVKGHPPIVIDIATGSFDVPKATFALMIFVPRANPLAGVSTLELRRLFAALPEGAAERSIVHWGDLGLKGAWATRPVHLYGFDIDNDKAQIFRQLVFRKGERWSPALHEFSEFSNQVGPPAVDAGRSIIEAVSTDPDGIGISNVFYATPAVKVLPLSTPEHPIAVAPTRASVANRSYSLTRAVYMVVNRDPGQPLSPAMREFLRFVLSRQGQQAVLQEGNYLPLSPQIASRELAQIAR